VLREIEAEARVAADPLSYNTVMVWLKQELELRLADDAGFDVVQPDGGMIGHVMSFP